ncbi:DUF4214 domain-containing protein [Aurantimonas sp. DM33-3]|uniref:DUF4214 domain-containing protein n=1 Tax=Aurantimonas sp. DM33-3 TaxID=2766955 RepID=UPI001652B350|nr:DUF4214 domain-containing protein [Aurantimonas sp. DM33-3]MBC6718788.1 DUF4214 domain-containing protein [Aurantimonas sp. DM33-3]
MDEQIISYYKQFLFRTPSAEEISYWAGVAGEGSLADVSAQIQGSPESVQIQTVTLPVIAFYQGLLGRAPDAAGLEYWSNVIANGDLTFQDLTLAFAASSEFQEKNPDLGSTPSTTEVVTLFYQNIMGREPDAQGLNFFLTALADGTFNVENVAASFLASPEFQTENGNALINFIADVADGQIDDPANTGPIGGTGDSEPNQEPEPEPEPEPGTGGGNPPADTTPPPAPSFSLAAGFEKGIGEGIPVGTVIGTLTSETGAQLVFSDGTPFRLDGQRVILDQPLDFETVPNVTFSVTAVDAAGNVSHVTSPEILVLNEFLVGGAGSEYGTIGAAVTAATDTNRTDKRADGEHIVIRDGIYQEQVVVDHADNLSLLGQGIVTISAPQDLVVTGAADARDHVALIQVKNSQNVSISGININGGEDGRDVSSVGGDNPTYVGISYLDSSGSVTGVTVANIRDPLTDQDDVNGAQRGYGVFVENTLPLGALPEFTLTNSTITGFQKGGVYLWNADVDITDNVIIGPGAEKIMAQNGIVALGSTGDIIGNKISGLGYAGTQNVQSTGIIDINNTNIKISNNNIDGAISAEVKFGGISTSGPDNSIVTDNLITRYGDLPSQARYVDNLYVGSGNPSDGFVLATYNNDEIVLGLDARITQGGSYDPIPGTNTFRIDPNSGRFAYSVSTNEASSLDDYEFRLLIDRDGSEDVDFVEFNLFRDGTTLESVGTRTNAGGNSPYDWITNEDGGHIVDDGGNTWVTQNIESVAWFLADGDDLNYGDEYTIKLQAFEKGTETVIIENEIVLIMGL